MARGWESKSVESQIESAESRKQDRLRQKLSPEQQEELSQRRLLELSRVRLQHQIQESTNERYRQMLTQALVDIDNKLVELDRPSIPSRKRNSNRSD